MQLVDVTEFCGILRSFDNNHQFMRNFIIVVNDRGNFSRYLCILLKTSLRLIYHTCVYVHIQLIPTQILGTTLNAKFSPKNCIFTSTMV